MAIDVAEFYRRYGPMVLRRCRRLLCDEQEAQSAMQDVFVNLLQNQDRLTGEAPSSLLYRMATNVCLNKIRAAGRRRELAGDEVLVQIACADDESRSLARAVLDAIFGGETESTRAMAVMHYVDGMTFQEVAREVGMSVSGVRKRLRLLSERVKVMDKGGEG
ncbi:MAG: sigma-70 family RNA polymerase sigma factor [Deltaproteobacteria bacterium]|nr:sigma-70 family RNA polymerase sigma factor [Deltaproteobacteria bacterium]